MHALVAGGADILELGVPFSDPMADGPTIQRASERALKHGVGLKDVLAMVAEFRQTNGDTPVVLMGYANPIEAMGWDGFCASAKAAGMDGVLTVDYPPEESGEFAAKCAAPGLDNIYLLAPTTPAERVDAVAKHARGFIYYVSLKGVTGAATMDMSEVAARLPAIRAATGLPVGVGFGIRDAETARQVGGSGRCGGDRFAHRAGNRAIGRRRCCVTSKTFVAGVRAAWITDGRASPSPDLRARGA
jgi:tryptophan synthase alpha chain